MTEARNCLRTRDAFPPGTTRCPACLCPPEEHALGDLQLSEIDWGIRDAVMLLRAAGVETFESCQGGDGHTYSEPTIRFHGERAEGFRALAVCIERDLPVSALRRIWTMNDGEPCGPEWELSFWPKVESS